MSSNLVKYPRECKQGDMVRFSTLTSTSQSKVGVVVGLCDYNIAKAYADVAAIHQEMQQINPELPKVEDMLFLIIEQGTTRLPYAYSQTNQDDSWFVGGQLEVVDNVSAKYIKLSNCSKADLYRAITLLSSAGFAGVSVANANTMQ